MHLSNMTVGTYVFRASSGDSLVSSLSSKALLKLPRCVGLVLIFDWAIDVMLSELRLL